MKKILTLIGVAALLATANAQTNSSWYDGIIGFAQGTSDSKQLTVAAYPGYAPNLTLSDGTKAPWGAGIALLYPVLSQYAFVGARVDWLANQFWAPSLNVTLKADVQLFNHTFTPFVLGGTIVPLGGAGDANREFGAIVGTGIYTTIWRPTEATSLQVFYAFEHWYNPLNCDVHRPGVAFTVKF
jgi:hypothetical protein